MLEGMAAIQKGPQQAGGMGQQESYKDINNNLSGAAVSQEPREGVWILHPKRFSKHN